MNICSVFCLLSLLLLIFFPYIYFLLLPNDEEKRRVYVISLNCFIVHTFLRWAVNITHIEEKIWWNKSRKESEKRKEKCINVIIKYDYNVSHFMLIQQHHLLTFLLLATITTCARALLILYWILLYCNFLLYFIYFCKYF